MKAVDQSNPGADEDAAQHERADDAPEQNAMLLLFRDRKKIEDDQEDEEIIGAEGNFQNVTSDELERYLASLPEIKKDGERSGEDNVDCAPSQGGAKTDGPAGTMQAQVQQQQ